MENTQEVMQTGIDLVETIMSMRYEGPDAFAKVISERYNVPESFVYAWSSLLFTAVRECQHNLGLASQWEIFGWCKEAFQNGPSPEEVHRVKNLQSDSMLDAAVRAFVEGEGKDE